MRYKFTFEDGSEAFAHYGVKGMKWNKHEMAQDPAYLQSLGMAVPGAEFNQQNADSQQNPIDTAVKTATEASSKVQEAVEKFKNHKDPSWMPENPLHTLKKRTEEAHANGEAAAARQRLLARYSREKAKPMDIGKLADKVDKRVNAERSKETRKSQIEAYKKESSQNRSKFKGDRKGFLQQQKRTDAAFGKRGKAEQALEARRRRSESDKANSPKSATPKLDARKYGFPDNSLRSQRGLRYETFGSRKAEKGLMSRESALADVRAIAKKRASDKRFPELFGAKGVAGRVAFNVNTAAERANIANTFQTKDQLKRRRDYKNETKANADKSVKDFDARKFGFKDNSESSRRSAKAEMFGDKAEQGKMSREEALKIAKSDYNESKKTAKGKKAAKYAKQTYDLAVEMAKSFPSAESMKKQSRTDAFYGKSGKQAQAVEAKRRRDEKATYEKRRKEASDSWHAKVAKAKHQQAEKRSKQASAHRNWQKVKSNAAEHQRKQNFAKANRVDADSKLRKSVAARKRMRKLLTGRD